MLHSGRLTGLFVIGAVALVLCGCHRSPQPVTPYSTDPRLVPKLDPILALPHYPPPSPNGYDALLKLVPKINRRHELTGNFADGAYHPPAPGAELATAPAQLADNREVLAALRQALKLEWLYPHRPAAYLLCPETAQARYLARLLVWDAALRERQGDTEGAVADLLATATLAVKLPRGGTDINWLAGRSCESLAFRELQRLVASQRLSPRELQALAARLHALEGQWVPLREIIAFSYECQGPQTLNLEPGDFAALLYGRHTPWWMRITLLGPRAGSAIRSFIAKRLPDLMAWDAKLARLSTQPYYTIRDQIPAPRAECDSLFVLCPEAPEYLTLQAVSLMRWHGVQAMAALELHRSEHGAYPDSLKALPDGTERLQDPFSGTPLVYRRTGAGYTLYSVGPDGKDNGGKRPRKTEPYEQGTDQVLWPMGKAGSQ